MNLTKKHYLYIIGAIAGVALLFVLIKTINFTKKPPIVHIEYEKKVLKPGVGNTAEVGMIATVHYVGRFLDGKQFDSSIDRNEYFKFKIGAGEVIEGWEKGIVGMKVEEKVMLRIPFGMAYGEKGTDKVPPNTPVVYEITLLDLLRPPKN